MFRISLLVINQYAPNIKSNFCTIPKDRITSEPSLTHNFKEPLSSLGSYWVDVHNTLHNEPHVRHGDALTFITSKPLHLLGLVLENPTDTVFNQNKRDQRMVHSSACHQIQIDLVWAQLVQASDSSSSDRDINLLEYRYRIYPHTHELSKDDHHVIVRIVGSALQSMFRPNTHNNIDWFIVIGSMTSYWTQLHKCACLSLHTSGTLIHCSARLDSLPWNYLA